MTKISLSIEQKSKHLGHRVIHQEIRLIARAVFVNKDRQTLSIERTGIVDTGAPISVIPYFIWKNLHVVKKGKIYLTGINQDANCQILCNFGSVLLRMVDDTNQSYGFPCWAYLVPSKYNQVPLIFGFDQCLDRFKLEIDIPKNKACLINQL